MTPISAQLALDGISKNLGGVADGLASSPPSSFGFLHLRDCNVAHPPRQPNFYLRPIYFFGVRAQGRKKFTTWLIDVVLSLALTRTLGREVMSAQAKTENSQVWLELYEVALVELDHPAKLAQRIAEAEKVIGERAVTLMREGEENAAEREALVNAMEHLSDLKRIYVRRAESG